MKNDDFEYDPPRDHTEDYFRTDSSLYNNQGSKLYVVNFFT